jgi:hypothetical protein
MKNFIFGVAVCSLLFGAAGCTEETIERLPAADNGALTFKAALGKQTRASETTITTLEATADAELIVNAYRSADTELFNKFTLVYDSGVSGQWSYSPVVYQPGDLLRYYSVYPDVAGTVTSDDYTFDYTVKTLASEQEDLLGAVVAPTLDEAIALQYNHLLSQINFAVQGIEDVKIELTNNITVRKVMSAGTYSFTDGWGEPTTPASPAYTYEPLAAALDTLAKGTSAGIVYLGNGGGTTSYENALMLMPQAFTPENAGTDGTFGFAFTLTTDADGDGELEDVAEGGATEFTGDALVNFGDFDTHEWTAGKRYIYVIDFTSFIEGGPITFTVAVADWEDFDVNVAQTVDVAAATSTSINSAIVLQSQINANNTALAAFPISVNAAIAADLSLGTIYGFDADDQIRIECANAASAAFVQLTQAGWSCEIIGDMVILTCAVPTVKGTGVSVDLTDVATDAALATAINTAIGTITATASETAHTEYTVNVGMNFAASGSTITPSPSSGDFVSGDIIKLVFPRASANNVVTASGWTVTTDGAEVILTKN